MTLCIRQISLLTAVVLATTTPVAPQSPGQQGGSLILAGGGDRSGAMRRFVELAGGPGARIAVVPIASAEPDETGRAHAAELTSLGARPFVYHIGRTRTSAPSAARQLDSATGIWFSGGDQARGAAALAGTSVLRGMRRRHREGAVVGGTSAGAALLPDSMITGNQSPPGDTTGYYGDEYPTIARRRIEIAPGLGFLPGVIVDQHFISRERHNRLLSAVLERPSLLGVGIDEGSALEVGPDGRWRVLGESAVLVYDARQARITDPTRPILGATGVRVHVLPAGGVFDPRTGTGGL